MEKNKETGKYLENSGEIQTLPEIEVKPNMNKNNSWTFAKQKEFANKLKAQGLTREAIEEYNKYLKIINMSQKD